MGVNKRVVGLQDLCNSNLDVYSQIFKWLAKSSWRQSTTDAIN
jgi:hypothetical protein